jgi:hypothetical protein
MLSGRKIPPEGKRSIPFGGPLYLTESTVRYGRGSLQGLALHVLT